MTKDDKRVRDTILAELRRRRCLPGENEDHRTRNDRCDDRRTAESERERERRAQSVTPR